MGGPLPTFILVAITRVQQWQWSGFRMVFGGYTEQPWQCTFFTIVVVTHLVFRCRIYGELHLKILRPIKSKPTLSSPFSASQAEYSAFTYSIQKQRCNRNSWARKNLPPQRMRKEKLKILWLNSQNSKITWPKKTLTKYIKIIIIGRKRYDITHKAPKY